MRCREGVTGTVDAMGAVEAFGTTQARATGRRRAVTRADRWPGNLERDGRRSSRLKCAAQCGQQLQAQIAPLIDAYGVAAMPTAVRLKNCRAQVHNATRKCAAEPVEAFSWCG